MLTEEEIKIMKEHLGQGVQTKDVAVMLKTTERTMWDYTTKEERVGWASIRHEIATRKAKETRRKDKYLKAGKILLNIRKNKHKQSYLTEEDANVIDLWDYQNDYEDYGYNDMKVESGLFGKATLNIPFPYYQPAKRLQTIGHGLIHRDQETETETEEAREERLQKGGWKEIKTKKGIQRRGNISYVGKKLWFGIWNWVRIEKPDIPLVDVNRHDVDTLNATIGFADSKEDRMLTQGDSCFISHSFADRFRFTIQKKATYFTSQKMDEVVQIHEGECIEIIPSEKNLTKKNHVKLTGIFRLTKQRKREEDDLWVNYGLITSHKKLIVGDKILGLTGLKVTVCEIRAGQEKDIVIHPKQILSKGKPEDIKGGMVKELQVCGKVMVGMRKDEYLGEDENLIEGGTISSVLYPVLKIYSPKMLRKIIDENSDFNELLKSLHLVYDKGTIKLTALEPDGCELAGHYLWDRHLLNVPAFYVGDRTEFDVKNIVTDLPPRKWVKEKGEKKGKWVQEEEGKTTINTIVWKYLYIPQFVDTGYVKKGEWKDSFFVDYISHGLERNLEHTIHKGKFPFIGNYRKTKEQKESKNEFNEIVSNILFCKIKTGLFLRCLPTLETNKIILSSVHRNRIGESCIVYREPVVSKNNVYSVSVKYDDQLSPYCVKLPLDIVQAANGDMDGDDWAILPYNDSNLNLSSHDIPKVEPDMTTIDLNMGLVPRTEDEIVEEAIEYRKKKTVEGMLTKDYGGTRNRAAFSNNDIEVQKEILKLASYLEIILKREKQTDEWKKDIKEKIRKLENYIPEEIIQKPEWGKWTLKDLVKKRYDQWKGLVGYTPEGFWYELFDVPGTETDRQFNEFSRNKKIKLGGI